MRNLLSSEICAELSDISLPDFTGSNFQLCKLKIPVWGFSSVQLQNNALCGVVTLTFTVDPK